MTTKHLGELNTMRFFCECGQGPADNCPGYHVTSELKRPGSTARHYAIVALLGLGIVLVFCLTAIFGRM